MIVLGHGKQPRGLLKLDPQPVVALLGAQTQQPAGPHREKSGPSGLEERLLGAGACEELSNLLPACVIVPLPLRLSAGRWSVLACDGQSYPMANILLTTEI